MPLKTRVFIRRADREDLNTVVAWMEDPDFQQFLYGDATRSPKQLREQIIGMLGRTNPNALPASLFLLLDTDEGPAGLLSLQNISWRNRSCSIDLYIGNKGVRNSLVAATAFFRAMQYAFDELNMHRVSAFIYAFNRPSWRIMELSGAVRELTLKDHVARDGQLYDMYGYGFLRSEYEGLRARYAERYPEATLETMARELAQKYAEEEAAG